MLKVKLLKRGKALTPYVAAVSQNGKAQRAFAEKIGIQTGQCVRSGVHQGMTQKQIRDVVKGCAPAKGTVRIKNW